MNENEIMQDEMMYHYSSHELSEKIYPEENGGTNMKIAVASEGTMVSGHFGHCEGFTMYNIENLEVIGKALVPNPGHKPGFLPVFLKEQKADVIIAGGMGEAAQELFHENGIEVVVGAQGNADDVVKRYLAGGLQSTGSICTEHAHEGHCNE